MSKEDDNDGKAEWPPKRSGRRKIGDDMPQPAEGSEGENEAVGKADGDVETASATEGTEDESAPSERIKLPGGVDLDAVMRQAIDTDTAPASVDVLRGVQDRLRERSGGKFYSDGWSTMRHPPFGTFFVTSLMMIAIVTIIYAVLVPLVGDPVELPREPEPVRVMPPPK